MGILNPMRKTPLSSAAAESASFAIHGDVLAEILIHLPRQSLIRLKLVCKHWLSIISSDEFLRRRRRRRTLLVQTRPSKLFKTHPFPESPILSPHSFPFRNPKILSSCSGLLLLESDSNYYVHNPTTNQSRRILLDYSENYPCIKSLALAFDPSKSARYTIALVRAAVKSLEPEPYHGWSRSDSNRSVRVEVYDSESRTWKIGSEPFTPSPERISFSAGAHCNNIIYWNIDTRIWYYDIGKGIISTLPFNPGKDSEIQESNGKIYTIISHRGDETVELWELQEERDWLRKYKCRIGCVAPPSIRYDGEMGNLVFHSSGKIMVYSIVDESLKEVVDLRDQPFYHEDDEIYLRFAPIFLFHETLALV